MAEAGREVVASLLRVAAAQSGAPAFRQEADRRRAEPFHAQAREVDLGEVAFVELAWRLRDVVYGRPPGRVVDQRLVGHRVSFLSGMALPPRGRVGPSGGGAIADR